MNEYMSNLFDTVKKEFPNVTFEQVYSGHIVDVEGTKLYVDLVDEINNEEEFTCEMDSRSFPQDPLYPTLTPGCIFYWYIGYSDNNKDKLFSLIRMSQAVWTEEMIAQAKVEAEKLYTLMGEAPMLNDPK
jgi:hypothetical protein